LTFPKGRKREGGGPKSQTDQGKRLSFTNTRTTHLGQEKTRKEAANSKNKKS